MGEDRMLAHGGSVPDASQMGSQIAQPFSLDPGQVLDFACAVAEFVRLHSHSVQ